MRFSDIADEPPYFFQNKWASTSRGLAQSAQRDTWNPEMADKWKRSISFLEHAKSFRANWDGENADPPRIDALDSVIYYLKILMRSAHPAPSRTAIAPDGAAFVEWQEPGLYMDLETSVPGSAALLIVEDGNAPRQKTVHWVAPRTPSVTGQSVRMTAAPILSAITFTSGIRSFESAA